MAHVLVTGSADGLGQLTARQLVAAGHEVILHARSEARAEEARAAVPGAAKALAGDLASIGAVLALAADAAAAGPLDAVIHNAGVGFRIPGRVVTVDGLEQHFAVNVLAPYLLTAAIPRPGRLVYLSSGLHRGVRPDLDDLGWQRRPWSGSEAYAESKALDVLLAFAVARRWPEVRSNAVEPGWVATKMGGPGAPDDPELGADTQEWLATSDEADALVTGRYLRYRQVREPDLVTLDTGLQDQLLEVCRSLTGVALVASGGAAAGN